MTGTIIIIVALVVVIAMQQRQINAIAKAQRWILTHVHVVPKHQAADPELKAIMKTFGVEDEKGDVK